VNATRLGDVLKRRSQLIAVTILQHPAQILGEVSLGFKVAGQVKFRQVAQVTGSWSDEMS
jgi:hypothetical protein